MKNIISLFLILSLSIHLHAQKKAVVPAAPAKGRITFENTAFDFGKISQWQPVSHTFKFKNTGTKPIYIYGVNRKCGCTTPRWTNGMIQPGDSGEVTITFNAAEAGHFDKEMSVSSNGIEEYIDIEITGEVIDAPMPDSLKQE